MANKKIFGLDISDHSIEAVLLDRSWKNIHVAAYARTLVRAEAVKNGIIKKPDVLATAIRSLLASAKPRPIKTPYCVLSIPDAQVFTSVFKFPAGLRRGEIMQTIPYKAEEVIPFKSSEIYFDFKTITLTEGTQEIFYVAVPKAVVDSYIQLLASIGLVPVALDIESVSLARVLLSPEALAPAGQKKEPAAVLLADIGARTTNLNIFDRHGIRQSNTTTIAGNRFTKALMTALSIKEKAANELKAKVGVDLKQEKQPAVAVLQKELARLVTEMQKTITFFKTENQRSVSAVVLAGGSSLMPGISGYLSQKLGLPVTVGNPFGRVVDPVKLVPLKKNAILFANVMGLGSRGTDKNAAQSDINLLPVVTSKLPLAPGRADTSAWRKIYWRLAALGVLLLVLGGLVWFRQNGLDVYRLIIRQPAVPDTFVPAVDGAVLDELRAELLLPKIEPAPVDASSTPTSTPALLVQKVLISKTSNGFLTVRRDANATATKVGQAASGTQYDLVSQVDGWYQIKLTDALTGWVSAAYATVVATAPEVTTGTASTTPPVVSPTPAPSAKIKIKATTLGFLNVRQAPSTASAKVGEAPSGTTYSVLVEQDGWYKIQLSKDIVGWVYSLYVDKL